MMNGLFLLNKALGLSSNRAMQEIKRLFQLKKIGHTGSLDPLASGMLPLCFGEATKFAQYLLNAEKTYVVSGMLGIQTSTGDVEGDVLHRLTVPDLALNEFQIILDSFRGTILQIPPMYSALKHQGQPLYRYALQGVDIERPARHVDILELELIAFESPIFTIRVKSSKGTYMRTLVEDIGQRIGCGAHVVQLHRLSTAGFQSSQMIGFAELEVLSDVERQNHILPMDLMVQQFPRLDLDAEATLQLMQGQVLTHLELQPEIFRVYDGHHEFFGLAEYVKNKGLMAKRLCVNPQFFQKKMKD